MKIFVFLNILIQSELVEAIKSYFHFFLKKTVDSIHRIKSQNYRIIESNSSLSNCYIKELQHNAELEL